MRFRHNHSPKRDGMARGRARAIAGRNRQLPGLEGLEDRKLLARLTTAGPITDIIIAPDSGVQVYHSGNDLGNFYSATPLSSQTATGISDAAGFFIRHSDGKVDGPSVLPAGSSTGAVGFTPVSQVVNGLTITTVFNNSGNPNGPGDKLEVTEVDTYQVGKEYYTSTRTIRNTGSAAATVDFFVAGDIYLKGSDRGVGLYNASSGAIGGTDVTGAYNIFFQPNRGTGIVNPTNYQADRFSTIWSVIGGTSTDFNNTANLPTTQAPYSNDPNYFDNGAGLEWKDVTIAAGASVTISNYTGFGAITSVVPDANLLITPTPNFETVEGSNTGGVLATFTHSNSTTPASGYTATIDWGDGTAPTTGDVAALPADPLNPTAPQRFSVSGTHIYQEETTVPYPVSITVVDNLMSVTNSASTTATVTDAPLNVSLETFFPTEGIPISAQIATLTDTSIFGKLSDFTATVDWGDGSPIEAITPGNIRPSSSNRVGEQPSFLIFGTHTYAEEGNYPVVVTVLDVGGATASNVPTLVNVPDSALIPVNVNVPVVGIEGGAFGGPVASFLDINPNGTAGEFTASIVFNGETLPAVVTADPTANARFLITPVTPIVFGKAGLVPILVRVDDEGGAFAEFKVVATVGDAPLSGAISPITGARGVPFSGNIAAFSDPFKGAVASDFTATIDWGDGTTGPGQILGTGPFTVGGTHTFANEGALTTSVVIRDKASGATLLTLVGSATIPDAPLSINGQAFSVQLGTPFSGTIATFTDGDATPMLSDFSAKVAWGDGTVVNAQVLPDPKVPGQFLVNASNNYAQPGVYPVGVVVTDRGGAAPAVAIFSSIVNAPPIFPLSGGLEAASDSGASNSDNVTNVAQPTYSGTAGPNAIVQIFGQNLNSPTGSMFGQGTADALGNWRITLFSPLPDGAYALVASALDAQGQVSSVPTRLSGGAPLFIVTSAPRVTNALYNSRTNTALVTIQTTGAPLDLATLTNPTNYTFTRTNANGSSSMPIAGISLTGSPSNVGVVIRLGVRQRPNGVLMTLKGGAIRDLAGNLLDGSFTGSYPSGSTTPTPGTDFRGQFFTNGLGVSQAVNAFPVISTQGAIQHENFLRSRRGRLTR